MKYNRHNIRKGVAKRMSSAAREGFENSGVEEQKKIWYNIDRSSKGTNT